MTPPASFARSMEPRDTEFHQLYRAQVGFVWRALRSLGVAEDALEDATHDVFVVVHRRWADWDRSIEVTTWLFGIARGVARNARRGHQRMARKFAAMRAEVPRAPPPSPHQHVVDRQAADLLEQFMARLDPEKRLVFSLCVVEGLSVADAARGLGQNPNTLATRLRRARQRFEAFVHEVNEERS